MIRQAEASLRDGERGQSKWALVGQQPRYLGRCPAVTAGGVRAPSALPILISRVTYRRSG